MLLTEPPVVLQGSGGLMQSQMVVPRQDCLFIHLDMKAIPRRNLYQAVTLKVMEVAPFSNPGFSAVRFGDEVSIWYWDNDSVRALASKNNLSLDGAILTAEPVLMSSPLETALLAFSGGYEKQTWSSGVLVDSQWIDSTEEELAQELESEQCYRPLFNSGTSWKRRLLPPEVVSYQAKIGAFLLLLIWLMAVTYEASSMIKYSSLSRQYELAFNDIVNESAPILDARKEAKDVRAQNDNLVSKLGVPSQAALMVEVDRFMPDSGILKSWHYSLDRLSMTVEDSQADLVEYINLFESSDLFSGVSVEPHPKDSMIILGLDIVGSNHE